METSIFKNVAHNVRGIAPQKFFKTSNCFEDEFATYPDEIKEDYDFDEETRTYFVREEIWSNKWRNHGPFWKNESHPEYRRFMIGGSEIADFCIAEDEKYLMELAGNEIPPHHYYSLTEKMDSLKGVIFEVNEDPAKKAALFELGHIEEPTIRHALDKLLKKEYPDLNPIVYNDTYWYSRKDKPFMEVNPDGRCIIDGVPGGCEFKTVQYSSRNYDLWKDKVIPLEYWAQCQWYMECLDLPYFVICVKFNMGDYYFQVIVRDMECGEHLLKVAEKAIFNVELGIYPNPEDEDAELLRSYYVKKYGMYRVKPEAHIASSYMEDIRHLQELSAKVKNLEEHMKDLKAEQAVIENKISELVPVGTNTIICSDDDVEAKVTLRNRDAYYKGFNSDKFLENEPELAEEYTHRNSKFDEKRFKDENPALYKNYVKKELSPADKKLLEAERPDVFLKYCEPNAYISEAKMHGFTVKFTPLVKGS